MSRYHNNSLSFFVKHYVRILYWRLLNYGNLFIVNFKPLITVLSVCHVMPAIVALAPVLDERTEDVFS